MGKKVGIFGFLAMAGLFFETALAAPVTIDPDDFADGTDISTAFAGVTLSTIFATGFFDAPSSIGGVFAVADDDAATGSNAFGQSATNSTWGNGSFEFLRVDFASAVSSVSLDFFANDSQDTNPILLAFDVNGNQIDSATFAGSVALGSPLTLTVLGQISYIFASWDELNRRENGGLDHLVYSVDAPVPLPAAALLFGTALVAGTRLRRIKA